MSNKETSEREQMKTEQKCIIGFPNSGKTWVALANSILLGCEKKTERIHYFGFTPRSTLIGRMSSFKDMGDELSEYVLDVRLMCASNSINSVSSLKKLHLDKIKKNDVVLFEPVGISNMEIKEIIKEFKDKKAHVILVIDLPMSAKDDKMFSYISYSNYTYFGIIKTYQKDVTELMSLKSELNGGGAEFDDMLQTIYVQQVDVI